MPTPEDMDRHRERLHAHRATLAHYLHQRALLGPANIRPEIAHGISEARAQIAQIKGTLRGWGAEVEDHPDDRDDPARPAIAIDQLRHLPARRLLWRALAAIALLSAALLAGRLLSSPAAPDLESARATPAPAGAAPPATMAPTAQAALEGCLSSYLADVPSDNRIVLVVDSGFKDKQLIGRGFPRDDILGVVLTKAGRPIGAARVRTLVSGSGFVIEEVVDAACSSTGTWRNGGEIDAPQQQPKNWDSVVLTIDGVRYRVRMGYPGEGGPVELIAEQL